jgi:hypothetical protein
MDDMREQVHQYLREVARDQEVTHYGDVAERIGLERNNWGHLNSVFRLLDKINEIESTAGRPLLSVVVVAKRSKTPGSGFFDSARELRRFSGETDEEKEIFFMKELAAVHRHWAKRSH